MLSYNHFTTLNDVKVAREDAAIFADDFDIMGKSMAITAILKGEFEIVEKTNFDEIINTLLN